MFLGVSSVVTMTTRCFKYFYSRWCDEEMNKNVLLPLLCFYFFELYYLILSENFCGLEIWNEIFWRLNFGLGNLGVLIFAPIQSSLSP